MRPGVPYEGMELAFYEECMRTIPAIALQRSLKRKGDVLATLNALHANGADFKVDPMRRWSILCAAYMAWTQQLFEANADQLEEPVEDLLGRAIVRATAWAADA